MHVESEEPSIAVEQVEPSRRENSNRWFFRWRLRNKSNHAMRLSSVRAPHGKFKAEERKLLPPATIAAGDSFILDMAVTCEEPPGTIIENAFLILFVDWQENHWRLFVRLQITVNQQGNPAAATQSITVQRVGFSGISN
jgi:hypothetical protein